MTHRSVSPRLRRGPAPPRPLNALDPAHRAIDHAAMGNAYRDDADPRTRRRVPWWAWPLLFLAILLAGWVIWNLSMDAAIEAELQAIRDAGGDRSSGLR